MFDIGFLELLVIAVVSLIILGPERLPDTARTIALWVGRGKRTFRKFRDDLEDEIGADDIRRQLRDEEFAERMRNIKQDLESPLASGSRPENEPTSNNRPSTATGDDSKPDAPPPKHPKKPV